MCAADVGNIVKQDMCNLCVSQAFLCILEKLGSEKNSCNRINLEWTGLLLVVIGILWGGKYRTPNKLYISRLFLKLSSFLGTALHVITSTDEKECCR